MKALILFLILIQIKVWATEQTEYPMETACHRFNVVEPAREPSLQPRCRVEKDVFYLDGVVDHQMTYEIEINYPHVKRVELNSFGGNVEHAYELARVIRERKIHTNVRQGAKCGSACTLILQAGFERTAHSSVRLMYHPVRRSSDWFNVWTEARKDMTRDAWREYLLKFVFETKDETQKLFQEYLKYGMHESFLSLIISQPEDPEWFKDGNMDRHSNLVISVKELKPFNILTGIYED